ncbi:uncharacterized protein LOC128987883 [Macrosteles quadrilineatus]|uniref:uncharacterized protein LOC128987883 n=1 Tax=Macrosteles quadrilineatus TaxID=74068 RepID=UPI0023E1DCBB|nr:uncharacterized protein LOC128987883 [Macrosteles quadrilineatus]
MLVQDIWRTKITWDEVLSIEHSKKWQDWLQEVKCLQSFTIPRCYFNVKTIEEVELHTFVDASEEAYAAVSYLRHGCARGTYKTMLVMARAKVAPLKQTTIPRLELQAPVLGCRIACSIIKDIDLTISRQIFWSDSVTVLHWLKSDPRQFKQYVSNRIGEIQDLSKPEEWRWVPSKQNPADVATRSNKKFTSAMHSEWIHGSSFLMRESSDWPIQPSTLQVKDNEETKKKFVGVVNSNENPPLLTVENFSSWEKVTRVLAWVHRFISMLRSRMFVWLPTTTATTKKKLKTVNVDFGNIPELQPEEIQKSEQNLISMSQKASFNEEKNLLLKNKPLPKSSRIFSLHPFIDQSLIRMSSRINSSPEISEEQKHPIILDGKSHTAKLIVKMFHEKCFHQGIETVINMTRQQFWILNV